MRTVISVTTLHLDWRLSRMRRVTYSWHKVLKCSVLRPSSITLSKPPTHCLYNLRHINFRAYSSTLSQTVCSD